MEKDQPLNVDNTTGLILATWKTTTVRAHLRAYPEIAFRSVDAEKFGEEPVGDDPIVAAHQKVINVYSADQEQIESLFPEFNIEGVIAIDVVSEWGLLDENGNFPEEMETLHNPGRYLSDNLTPEEYDILYAKAEKSYTRNGCPQNENYHGFGFRWKVGWSKGKHEDINPEERFMDVDSAGIVIEAKFPTGIPEKLLLAEFNGNKDNVHKTPPIVDMASLVGKIPDVEVRVRDISDDKPGEEIWYSITSPKLIELLVFVKLTPHAVMQLLATAKEPVKETEIKTFVAKTEDGDELEKLLAIFKHFPIPCMLALSQEFGLNHEENRQQLPGKSLNL